MPGPYPFSIELDGHRYGGTWQLMLGRLCVRSAWGNESVDCCAGTKPEPLARKTLERIVRADQRQRAQERVRQEREAAKLRKPRRVPKATDHRCAPN